MATRFLRRAQRLATSAGRPEAAGAMRAFANHLMQREGGGCGVYFDDGGIQLVRLERVAGPARVRVSVCGTAALPEGAIRAGRIGRPEAVAGALVELCERLGLAAHEMRSRDTTIVAVPAHFIVTETVSCPSNMAPRAQRAWGERFAASLLDDDDGRRRVGVAWAGASRKHLRVFACPGEVVDDRLAVMELAGIPAHAVDAAPLAGRRAYLWGGDADRITDASDGKNPHGLVQMDEHGIELSVFDAADCLANARVATLAREASAVQFADVIRDMSRQLSAVPQALWVAPGNLSMQTVNAFCDAAADTLSIPVQLFDSLGIFDIGNALGLQRQSLLQRAALATGCGLALRALAHRGLPLR